MKKVCKWLSLVLAATLLLPSVPLPAVAEDKGAVRSTEDRSDIEASVVSGIKGPTEAAQYLGVSVSNDDTFAPEVFHSPVSTRTTIMNAIKTSRSDNIIYDVANSVKYGYADNAINLYLANSLPEDNQYITLHNNYSSTGVFFDLSVYRELTYNASENQYIVYDFDIARLSKSDPNFSIASITRDKNNSGSYFTTHFLMQNYISALPLGEMKHATVVYDFNNNVSYLYVNNVCLASIQTGVMSAAGHSAFKSGEAVNHNSMRLMNPLLDIALDNATIRHIRADDALAAALGADLSAWDGAIYHSAYTFPTVHPMATFDGENVYFDKVLAEKMAEVCESDVPHSVELLRDAELPLVAGCSVTVETHGLKHGLRYPSNAEVKTEGTVITVEIRGGLSLITTVKVPSIYQSGMVFQREEPITVRGYCESEGSEIRVTLGASSLVGVTDANGEWEVTFPAMAATKGLTLTVEQLGTEDGASPLTFGSIDVGDVFLLSGQSNMDYNVQYMEDYLELKANANNYRNLRGYLSNNVYRHGEDGIGQGKWYALTADNIGKFPASGYAMAIRLAMAMDDDVTIAIVEASYPGSTIKTWLDADVYIDAYGNNADVQKYKNYLAFYEQNGRCPTSKNDLPTWDNKWTLAMCYDALITPLDGYRVKAVVWDQGSGDLGGTSYYAEQYALLQECFNTVLRTENVPFIMMNLAPRSAEKYKDFLIMQYGIAAADPYTHLVSAGNEGAMYNSYEWSQNPDLSLIFVHTSRKSPIGTRAANVILEELYGIDADSTPLVSSVTASGASLVLTLTENMTINYGTAPLMFEIAGADGRYRRAEAVINGNVITLTADGVSSPVKVRYAYSDFVIELQDGTIIEVPNGYKNSTQSATSLTVVTADGKTYVIHKDACESIRSYCTGNVTSVAGSPLPAFELAVGYTAE